MPPKPADEAAANGGAGAPTAGEAAEPAVISYARAAEDFFVQVLDHHILRHQTMTYLWSPSDLRSPNAGWHIIVSQCLRPR